MKDELRNVLSGKSKVRFGEIIQTISSYLRKSTRTSTAPKDSKLFKKQETEVLERFIAEKSLWIDDIDFSKYVSEGAEQKVYLKDDKHVIKLNDAIYYLSWIDYFHNLLLHNYFFSDTAYELLGFTMDQNNVLYAVVQQTFVTVTTITDLQEVKDFLAKNGFSNTRNHDYFNSELGIILEDLHDENVLTNNGIPFFIDTVFYLTNEFWKD
ncbi:putative polyvalent protein kinase domain-containing protein [Pedobacter chitinilyticus]|uniref:Uncharacterized protein n=1 Tax=Pedobacter chitinilyticus TaxID=2233776 RepID=A0A443Z1F4_9SPHI|nr:hypothetical protein [Pedobacter chitinilyticus]RWU10367.1 hypothetical protein DPV69_03235 [Pedobacter chitinilyticus]